MGNSAENVEGCQSNTVRSGAYILFCRIEGSQIGMWVIKHLVSPIQRWIYYRSGGRIFSTIGAGRNVLLLTTRGRLTGKYRTVPVFYLCEGKSVVICNVTPKFERINPWVVNLRANPEVHLRIGREGGIFQAREATRAEVELFWPRFVSIWPVYQIHYENTNRRVIFILEKAQGKVLA